MNQSPRPQRIVVIGTSCAGKTTFSKALANALGITHIELDALFWEPDWKEADTEVFKDRVKDSLKEKTSWIVDGNYSSKIQDLVWSQADTIVWLANRGTDKSGLFWRQRQVIAW